VKAIRRARRRRPCNSIAPALGYVLIQQQRSCRTPIRHLLPQQWDALQTTLNHLPNPIVDVAKSCFAVRFGSTQNERERKLKVIKKNSIKKQSTHTHLVLNSFQYQFIHNPQQTNRLGDLGLWVSFNPGFCSFHSRHPGYQYLAPPEPVSQLF